MKKTTKGSFIAFGIASMLISTAFTLRKSTELVTDKFGNTAHCGEKSSNGSKVAYTQSAHDQTTPGTCNGCHAGGSATPVITISASPAFGAGDTYVPGQTYTISYDVTGYPKYGFDLEMNDGNTTTSMGAGTLSALTHTRYTATPSGGYPANISHNAALTTGTIATFRWVAPSTSTTVYLFSNGLGVNGNGNDGSGDKEAFKNMILTAEAGSGLNELSAEKSLKLFPNPAKSETTISYSTKGETNVSITIVDLKGKIVSHQLNQRMTEGSHSTNLDVTMLQSGTYFVRVKADDVLSTQKLIVE